MVSTNTIPGLAVHQDTLPSSMVERQTDTLRALVLDSGTHPRDWVMGLDKGRGIFGRDELREEVICT